MFFYLILQTIFKQKKYSFNFNYSYLNIYNIIFNLNNSLISNQGINFNFIINLKNLPVQHFLQNYILYIQDQY